MEPVWLLSSGDQKRCPNPEAKIEEIVLSRREVRCVKVISAIAVRNQYLSTEPRQPVVCHVRHQGTTIGIEC